MRARLVLYSQWVSFVLVCLSVGGSVQPTVLMQLCRYRGRHNVGGISDRNYIVAAQICWFVSLLSEVEREKVSVCIIEARGTTLLSLHNCGAVKEPQDIRENTSYQNIYTCIGCPISFTCRFYN